MTKNSDVNFDRLIKRIRNLEYLLSNSYKVQGGTEISFDLRTLLDINAMDVYLIKFWIAKNYDIRIENNKLITNEDPLNINMVDNNGFNEKGFKEIMSGGVNDDLTKYKKNGQLIEVSQMLGWRLLWLFMWMTIFFITLQTFRYFFIDSMSMLNTISTVTLTRLVSEARDPYVFKNPAITDMYKFMEEYKKVSGLEMDSNGREENYNYGLAELGVIESFSGGFKESVDKLNLLQLPSPSDSYVFDDNVTKEFFPMYKLYLDIFSSVFLLGDPSKLGDLFNPLYKRIEPGINELRDHITEKQQRIKEIKENIEELTKLIGKDLRNTERVISSSTPILTAAADYTTDFFKFISGATPTSKVAVQQRKLLILMELLRLLPRVSNHITTAIPDAIGDIYSIHNNLQTLSNMCMAMYVISGIITYIIQTVFYYIIVAILKVGGGDKDTKITMIDTNYIFAKILHEASKGKLSPEIITFIITRSQLKDIKPDIAITVAPEFKHFINNDDNIQTALNELCKYLADPDNVINLKNLYKHTTGLAIRTNVLSRAIKDNSLLSNAIENGTVTDNNNKKLPLLITDSGGRRIRKYNRSKKPRKKQKSKKTRRKMRKSKNKSKK
jgi:hypothetical protein